MKQGRWAIGGLCIILGMMVVFQIRMTKDISKNNISLQRVGDITVKLEEVERQRDSLKKELESIKNKGTYKTLIKDNERLKYEAGLTDVKGQGVIVTINDSKVPVKSDDNPNLYLIHDEDILKIINELRAAGAEAISINNQRVIATTEIRCVGPTITINRKSFAPPYVVKAIGNSQSLAGALRLRGGIVDTLKYWGIQLNIEESQNIIVPAYKGTYPSEFGKIYKGGDKK